MSMKKILIVIGLTAWGITADAQVREFGQADEGLTAFKGDTILIQADTAAVVSSRVTRQLSSNLDEYRALRAKHEDLIETNHLMISYLRSVQQNMAQVIRNHEEGQLQLDELREVSEGLIDITGDIDQNNELMTAINEDFEQRIEALEAENKDLNNQIRHLWFDGVTDKLITGGLGMILGVMLVLALGGG